MTQLPEPWRSVYAERKAAIVQRLREFSQVPPSEHFYELTYCILTPQSSARNAEATIAELRGDGFYEKGFDPTPYLRDPRHYIRFHNVKAKRLLHVRERFDSIGQLLLDKSDPQRTRAVLIELISGLGLKESSHYLRNIGFRELAILDRHILRHLARLGVIPEEPRSMTTKRYLEIESLWHAFAKQVAIPLDELDLLFWSMETGEILK